MCEVGMPAAASEASVAASQCCRSEEHTSELQSQFHLVCRLLLEKKNELELEADDLAIIGHRHEHRAVALVVELALAVPRFLDQPSTLAALEAVESDFELTAGCFI